MKSKVTESKRKKLINILKYITERKELLKFFEEIYPRPPFEKLINNWLTNIESFTNKEEFIEDLTQLLEKSISAFEKSPIPGQLSIFKEDKDLKKFKKIYTHSEMENIMNSLLNTQRLRDKGIKNLYDDSITGSVKTWEGKGVDYIVKVDDLIKLAGKPPKVYVSQIKNLLLLMGMIQEQQFNNSTKEPRCEFKLSYYAERRGYSKEDIMKGGNFFNELKRDLLSGAITSFGKIFIKDKKYTVYNSFYALYVPEDPGNNWIIEFNNPYQNLVMQILNGEAGQYFVQDHKAIEDRETTNNPYLFLFYQQLIKRKRANLLTTPVKIGSLLKDMQLPEDILARPRACYEQLREYVSYFGNHYDPPEIEEFFIYNDFHKTKTIKQRLYPSEAFSRYSYEDFKGLLNAIGIKDIREAYISFKRPYKKPKEYKLSDEEEQLLDRTLKWFNCQITKVPREDQEGMIKMYIKKLGYDNYRELFEREANKTNANAVEFLTKVLPDELREFKENLTYSKGTK